MPGIKGMKFKNRRREPKQINDGRICDYGCGEIAQYEFGTGKVCCRKHGGNCPAKRKTATKKFKKYVHSINPDTGEKRSIEMSRKAAKTLENQIDPDTGLPRSITVRRKITENRIKSGVWIEKIKEQVERKHNTIDPETGLSIHQSTAIKGRDTRLADVDESGRNSYERMWEDYHPQTQIHESTGLYCQSSNELSFLESLTCEQKQKVRRGPATRYIDPNTKTERIYHPDFLIENTVYEIKSGYSWIEYKGEPQREKNIAKLNAVTDQGYNVIVVIDGIHYKWPCDQI